MMKKLMPLLILMIMGLLLFMSWSNTNDFKGESARKYSNYIEEAQKLEEKKIYVDAVKKYESALKVKSNDFDTAMKIISLYDELGDSNKYISACKNAIKCDNSRPEPYLLSAKKNLSIGEKDKAYEILKEAESTLGKLDEKPQEALDEVEELIIELKSDYLMLTFEGEEFFGFHYIDGEKNEQARVRIDDHYGIMNGKGTYINQCEFEDINLTANKLTPVKVEDEYYYIDEDGNRKIVTDKPADYIGIFSDKFAPVSVGGTYGYISDKMEEVHFEYEYAGPFENGVAAVKKDGKWGLINKTFSSPTDFVYDEILTDSYGFCATYGVFWAKKDGKYNLYDLKGEQIAGGFDDARLFASEEPAAVCQNGKWGYISKSGEIVIEPKYKEAQSFSLGYGPILKDGKWGCIDNRERIVIEPVFSKMLPFGKSGCAYVEEDDFPFFVKVEIYD